MNKWIIAILLLSLLVLPVSAMEFTAPDAPVTAQKYMPEEEETFVQGIWHIIKTVMGDLRPNLANAMTICLRVIVCVFLMGIFSSVCQSATNSIRLTGAVIIGIILLEPVNAMLTLGTDTVRQLSDYGKLLLPVMTASLAAQGGCTASAALYTGTVFFNAVLSTAINKLAVPALYIYLCLCVADCALEQDMLKRVRDFMKWIMTWSLKWTLYIFTGYISVTGVVSGVVDSSTLKAAKLTISGMVPVVGGILSEASETILVSAGVMKNAAGIYGILAVFAICAGPFLKIGVQYLLLKLSGAVCHMFGYKRTVTLVQDFTTGMGMILAMTGSVCILLLVSLVCFMKGIT